MRSVIPVLIVVFAGVGGAATAVSTAGAQSGGGTRSGAVGPAMTATAMPGTTQPPVGSSAQQTHPVVHPKRPTRRSHVSVRVTLSDAPGHEGVVESDYLIQVDQPIGSRAACAATAPPNVTSGTRGTRVSVALPSPRYGWCHGRYTATVFLQRGPYCPTPPAGQPPQPCPEFASRDLQVGRRTFVVRAPRR